MKVLVLNGSPKGNYSVTLQTVNYLEILYPEHDFQILKKYMDVFISLIETKLLIANPPVARKS